MRWATSHWCLLWVVAGCGRLNFVSDEGMPRTCLEAARRGIGTGSTTIDPDGDGLASPREVWCEQDRRGGGWALVLKIDGQRPTFHGTSPLWTDATLFDAANLDPQAPGEAKLVPYIDYPVAEVMLVVVGGGDIVLPLRAASLQAAMASGITIATSVPEPEWRAAFGTTSLEPGCRRQGFGIIGNPPPDAARRLRIGLVANETPGDCRSPDSFLGVGGDVPCPDGTMLSAGAASSMRGDAGALCTPARVLVFVRDDDRTHHPAQASCRDHLAAGRTDNGIYLIGNPAMPRRCEMTIDGGGWTSALDLDSVRDPCPAPWQPTTTAPRLCINPAMDAANSITIEPPLASYREVMVSLLGFQSGTADAFEPQGTINDVYLDGLSITADMPRQHIATYATGFDEGLGCDGIGGCTCPCLGGTPLPPFVPAESWRCEAGALSPPQEGTIVLPDPLFDAAEQPPQCAGKREASADPIRTTLGIPTSAPLEARLMRNEPRQGEGLAVHRLELWVR